MPDASSPLGLPLNKPVRELNQVLQVDFRRAFRSIFKGIINQSTGRTPKALSNLVDGLLAVGCH